MRRGKERFQKGELIFLSKTLTTCGFMNEFLQIREMCACLPRQAINMYKKLCPHCQKASRTSSSSKNALLIKKKKTKEVISEH